MKKFGLFLGMLLLFWNCDHKKSYLSIQSQHKLVINDTIHPGKKLLESNCYLCHGPMATEQNRLAPPMIAIKRHYITENTSKEDFVNDIQNWVEDPSEEKALMFGAVRRFGVMPKTPFAKETIEQIADYMFDYEIDQPEWFEEHFNRRGGKHRGKQKRRRGSL